MTKEAPTLAPCQEALKGTGKLFVQHLVNVKVQLRERRKKPPTGLNSILQANSTSNKADKVGTVIFMLNIRLNKLGILRKLNNFSFFDFRWKN